MDISQGLSSSLHPYCCPRVLLASRLGLAPAPGSTAHIATTKVAFLKCRRDPWLSSLHPQTACPALEQVWPASVHLSALLRLHPRGSLTLCLEVLQRGHHHSHTSYVPFPSLSWRFVTLPSGLGQQHPPVCTFSLVCSRLCPTTPTCRGRVGVDP